MAFPLRLQRRHVHDDAAPGIGGLAEADHQHIARDAEILDRPRQHEAVGRDDAHRPLAIDEAVVRAIPGVAERMVDTGEELEVVRHARAIANGRQAVADRSEEHTSELESLMSISYAVVR